jgi:lipoprotein-anchoring transpeptidase ErfK/SrfK
MPRVLALILVALLGISLAAAETVARPGLSLATLDHDTIVHLQVFLDRHGFSPGKIDGRAGEFLSKSLRRFQRAIAVPITGTLDPELGLQAVDPVLVPYTVTTRDLARIGPCPTQPAEQALVSSLPYVSVREFLTERFHCSPQFLQVCNPQWVGDDLPVGATVLVPNVEPFRIEDLAQRGAFPKHPEFSGRRIRVSRAERMLDLWEGDNLLASYPVTPGGGAVETPAGSWHIVAISPLPTFRWDRSVLETGRRSATFFLLPPGPNNPVGVLWCALNRPGIGIHGTDNPQTIGRATSHGCLRLANWDVVRLAAQITPGVAVAIE